MPPGVQRRLRVLQIRSHTAHIDVHLLEKEQVIGQIGCCLERKSYHNPCAYLIAALAQVPEGLYSRLVTMNCVHRMDLLVQFPGRGLYPQQIPMGSGLIPLPVHIFRLLSQ